MFILKLVDKKYGGWGYISKNNNFLSDIGCFRDYQIFQTEEEARQYIQSLLKSKQFRKDITKDSFEIVEVKQYKEYGYDGFDWMTDEYFERIKD